MMCQFNYNQGGVILSDDHSTLSAFVEDALFTGQGLSQILASKKKLYWPGQDRV